MTLSLPKFGYPWLPCSGRVHGVETTGEMNWQLLIKIVSSSLALPPYPAFRFSLWFVQNRPTEPEELAPFRCSWTLGFRRTGVRWGKGEGRGGGFRSSSGGDAVSILFVHANYSSSVTLLEIEGTGTPLSSVLPTPLSIPSANLSRSFRVLFARLPGPFSFLPARSSPLPWGFPNGPRPRSPPSPTVPIPYSSLFSPARHEISLSLPEDFTKDFNFPATPSLHPLYPTPFAITILAVIRRQASRT